MTRFVVLGLLSVLLAGCVVVFAGYVFYDNGYYRGHTYYGYGYGYRGYYRDHGQ